MRHKMTKQTVLSESVLVALLVLVTFLWGNSFIAIKHVVGYVTPLELVPLRFIPVAMVFAVWILISRRSEAWLMVKSHGWHLALIGLTGAVFYNIFLGWGETRIAAGTASLIISLNPAFIFTLSILFLREPFVWRRMFGLLVAFAGLAIIIVYGSGQRVELENVLFALITMLAPCMWAIYTVLGKSLVKHFTPLLATAVSMVFAGMVSMAFLRPSLMHRLPMFPPAFWWSILFLSLPCTIFGFVVWFKALERLPASRVAGFVYLVPMFGVTCSHMLLHEPITVGLLFGAAILLAGIFLVNRH